MVSEPGLYMYTGTEHLIAYIIITTIMTLPNSFFRNFQWDSFIWMWRVEPVKFDAVPTLTLDVWIVEMSHITVNDKPNFQRDVTPQVCGHKSSNACRGSDDLSEQATTQCLWLCIEDHYVE